MTPVENTTVPGIAPAASAIGIAVLLVGLIVDPLVIAPIGAAIAIAASFPWLRRGGPVAASEVASPRVAGTGERYSRSRVLERATLALGGLVGLGVALPAAGFAILPSFFAPRHRSVDLGPISAFPEDEFVVATFLADPQAGEASRRAAYVRNNGFIGNVPSFTILSSRCTHVGCPTQPNGPIFARQRQAEHGSGGEVGLVPTQPSGFGCPCHGSQFDKEGNRTAGPAPRALDRYEFSIHDGRLTLGRLYSVSRVDGTGAQARHPQLRAHRRRRARHRPRVAPLPAVPAVMSLYELEIGWAVTAAERRYLHWELLACEEVLGVFLAARDEVLAVLFDGEPREFRKWARTLDSRHPQTHQKGASQ